MTNEPDPNEPDTSSWQQTPDGIPIPPPFPDDVLYESGEGFARITLNRPRVLNALSKNVMRLLDAAIDRAEADPDVRAIILTGAGRAFSPGGDLWSSLYPDDDPAPGGIDLQMKVWRLSKPVIAAVRGHALGQACELAGVCDFTIASVSAKFGEVQIRNGAGPPVLITPFLVGQKQAKEMLLLGEIVDAQEALRIGLVNRVVEENELESAAEAIAVKLAALPPNAVRLNKALVNHVYELIGLPEAVAYRDNEQLSELAGARDNLAEERRRRQQEEGWAAFKEERDKGYSS